MTNPAFGYRVPITAEVVELARHYYPLGRDHSKTDLGIEAPIVGAFGEAVLTVAAREVGLPVEYVGDKVITHDLQSPVGLLEVKTKATNYRPGPNFFAGFSASALEFQKADLFVFVSLWPKAGAEDACSRADVEGLSRCPAALLADQSKAFERIGLEWIAMVMDGWGFPKWVRAAFDALLLRRGVRACIGGVLGYVRYLERGLGMGNTPRPFVWCLGYDPVIADVSDAVGVTLGSFGTLGRQTYSVAHDTDAAATYANSLGAFGYAMRLGTL